jgi:hypothetical protein
MAIRFVHLAPDQMPPQERDWLLIRKKAAGRCDLFLAEGLANRIACKAARNIFGHLNAYLRAVDVAQRAGLSIIYVSTDRISP